MLEVLCPLYFLLGMNHMHECQMTTNQGEDEKIWQCNSFHLSSSEFCSKAKYRK